MKDRFAGRRSADLESGDTAATARRSGELAFAAI
jgi:hypothetical protein